jgi:AAA+ ATPase superfamily predicted ATPase
LNKQFVSGAFECSIIYGRRRVGKTSLLTEFIKGKPTIFFTARETNAQENLLLFSQCINRFLFNQETVTGDEPVFRSFENALNTLFQNAEKKRLILVIDEFPYLAQAYRGISSLLQEKIDQGKEHSKLFIILCGSSMSFMENQVLGYQSPLYGRRTAQYKVEPFDFFESAAFFPGFNPVELIQVYSMTGGIPLYLSLFNDHTSIKENVIDNFLTRSGFLFEEPENLLKQELREPANCNAVIREIASGSTKISEIASKTGLETAAVSHLIKTLLELGIVKKESPVTESVNRKSIYKIADNLFRFWYRFIPDIMDIIQRDNPQRAYEFIEAGLPAYIGSTFEDICGQYLWQENNADRLPFFFQKIGRWWGNDPIKRRESEIDLLALRGKTHAMFCECKWTNQKIDKSLLDTLIEKSQPFHFSKKYYCLFSKNGFTSGCEKAAASMDNVKLASLKDMVKK